MHFKYDIETFLSFYFEVLYSWNESFFKGIDIQEQWAGSTRWTDWVRPAHPDAHSGFVRQEEWLESLCLFTFLDCYWSSSYFGILDSVRLTGSSLSCSHYYLVFTLPFTPCSSKFSLCWWSLCTFVNCICVNVFSRNDHLFLKLRGVLCVGLSNCCIPWSF